MDNGSGHSASTGHSAGEHAVAYGHAVAGHTAIATIMLASHDLSFCSVGHDIAFEALAFAFFAHATSSNANQALGHVSAAASNRDFGQLAGHSDGASLVTGSKQAFAVNDPRSLYVHVVNHGFGGLYHEMEDFAKYLGLNCIDNKHTDIYPQNVLHDELIGVTFGQNHFKADGNPTSIYPDATGKTHVWRRYFQIKPNNGKHVNHVARTFIEVIGVTWFYAEKRNFETKVFFNVISLPVYDPKLKEWGFEKSYFTLHQKDQEKLARLVYGYLVSLKPKS